MAELILQGKAFKQITNSTFEHDAWTIRVMNLTGLNNIAVLDGETPQQLAERYTREAIGNPYILKLFGGLMIPAEIAPEDWTPEIAEQTSEFIAKITDPDSKRLLQSQVASMVADFFLSGIAALKISPSSSEESKAADPDTENEALSISATGGR